MATPWWLMVLCGLVPVAIVLPGIAKWIEGLRPAHHDKYDPLLVSWPAPQRLPIEGGLKVRQFFKLVNEEVVECTEADWMVWWPNVENRRVEVTEIPTLGSGGLIVSTVFNAVVDSDTFQNHLFCTFVFCVATRTDFVDLCRYARTLEQARVNHRDVVAETRQRINTAHSRGSRESLDQLEAREREAARELETRRQQQRAEQRITATQVKDIEGQLAGEIQRPRRVQRLGEGDYDG